MWWEQAQAELVCLGRHCVYAMLLMLCSKPQTSHILFMAEQLQKTRQRQQLQNVLWAFFYVCREGKKENISNMRVLFYYILLHISWLPNAYTHRRRGGTKRGLRGGQTVLGLKVGSFRARVLATFCARPEHVQRISVSADKRAHLWIGLDSLPVCLCVCV